MRVERPGIGDSEGPDCSECDLEADMAGYRAALAALKRYDFVDKDNLFLLGASIGGALAPVLAQDERVRGLIVSGGFAKTWGEHMLEHERKRLELSGKSPAEIDKAMRAFIDFYSLYLNNRMAPSEVIRSKPSLAAFWYDEPGGQYGRPAVYYQQVQKLNVGAAWARISAPVLILYGEYDWIMSRGDQDLIVDIVNRRHPGNARLTVHPKMDHNLDIYDSIEKAFKGEGRTFDARVVDLIIDWLKATKRP
jgi:pimeloyl-ACP methyl ester carboxylesterase